MSGQQQAAEGPVANPPIVEPLSSARSVQDGPAAPANPRAIKKTGALLIAIGILLSRIAGFVRERTLAHYFGNSPTMDAFKAASRIPNFLQNLFGEGVLSASFIPVYARLLAENDEDEAGRVAGAILSVLMVGVSVLVLLGVLATPILIDLIAPGFQGETRSLAIELVQILFPGAGLLVLAAWCLGVLNSHRRFFLSYAAPVLWNFAQITALIVLGRRLMERPLIIALAWSLVAGSVLQLLLQLPQALRLVKKIKLNLDLKRKSIHGVITNFFPVLIARGVVQISAYIDTMIASLLPSGAVSALSFAQILYLLPVSLFGMSVSAAELPAMSSVVGDHTIIAQQLREKLTAGIRRIAFFVIPSGVAFIVFGDLLVGLIFETGKFSHQNTIEVWWVLGGSSVGILAATTGRLYSSCFYSMRDTRTPFVFAIVRVVLTIGLGFVMALWLPGWVGLSSRWGAPGLTASAGISAWVEFLLLRSALQKRIGNTSVAPSYFARLWGAALLGAAAVVLLKGSATGLERLPLELIGIFIYCVIYFVLTLLFKVEQAEQIRNQVLRRWPGAWKTKS